LRRKSRIGIDEIYIDLSDIPEETEALARRIKQAVFDATGLTCSIGISPNKLLSKIGSTSTSQTASPSSTWNRFRRESGPCPQKSTASAPRPPSG
jgi:nucleotidyltransferase/DNA polymerase involved in DNA repair